MTTTEQAARQAARGSRKTMVEACREALREAMLEDDVGLHPRRGHRRRRGRRHRSRSPRGCRRSTAPSGPHHARSPSRPSSGAAIGAAIAGMRPVAEIMLMNFITVAMDQIVNHAAKLRYMSGGQTACRSRSAPPPARAAAPARSTRTCSRPGSRTCPGSRSSMPSYPGRGEGLLCRLHLRRRSGASSSRRRKCYGTRGELPGPGVRIPLARPTSRRAGRDITIVGLRRRGAARA